MSLLKYISNKRKKITVKIKNQDKLSPSINTKVEDNNRLFSNFK